MWKFFLGFPLIVSFFWPPTLSPSHHHERCGDFFYATLWHRISPKPHSEIWKANQKANKLVAIHMQHNTTFSQFSFSYIFIYFFSFFRVFLSLSRMWNKTFWQRWYEDGKFGFSDNTFLLYFWGSFVFIMWTEIVLNFI